MSDPTEAKRNEHLRFAARIYRMRSLGLGLGCVAVGGTLYEDGAAWYWWLVLVFNGYLWPTLAYSLARRSRDPRRTELRNLVVDSMAGGMWVAVMQFKPAAQRTAGRDVVGRQGRRRRMEVPREEAVTSEFARGERSGRRSALLMLDIDHFKEINDAYGHPIGDKVLKGVAAILRSNVRDIDTAGRYGGDEFGVVLAEASLDDAKEVAERIRTAADTLRITEAPGLRCAVSIGIAAADSSLSSVGEWVRRADRALYRAKQEGRNRIAHDDMDAAPAGLCDESVLVPDP